MGLIVDEKIRELRREIREIRKELNEVKALNNQRLNELRNELKEFNRNECQNLRKELKDVKDLNNLIKGRCDTCKYADIDIEEKPCLTCSNDTYSNYESI